IAGKDLKTLLLCQLHYGPLLGHIETSDATTSHTERILKILDLGGKYELWLELMEKKGLKRKRVVSVQEEEKKTIVSPRHEDYFVVIIIFKIPIFGSNKFLFITSHAMVASIC
ncbi:hypothetical protein ACJX0J_033757, partial [Zea mays]